MRKYGKPHICMHNGRWVWSISHGGLTISVYRMDKAAAFCQRANAQVGV